MRNVIATMGVFDGLPEGVYPVLGKPIESTVEVIVDEFDLKEIAASLGACHGESSAAMSLWGSRGRGDSRPPFVEGDIGCAGREKHGPLCSPESCLLKTSSHIGEERVGGVRLKLAGR